MSIQPTDDLSQPAPDAGSTPPAQPPPIPDATGAAPTAAPESSAAAPASVSGRLIDPNATPSDRQYCMFMHLTILLSGALAVLAIIAPLIMWQVKKDNSPFIDDHGKETLNFHISLYLYAALGFALLPVCGLGIGVWVAAGVLAIVGCILASVAAHRGEYYRYPMCIRFLR